MTPSTITRQAPLSVEFSREEHWSGLPFPSPEDLLGPRIKPGSPALQVYPFLSEPPGNPSHSGSAEPCLSLGNPMDCSPSGFSVHGALQVRTLDWVAMPSSRGSSQPRVQTQVSCTAGAFFTIWAIGLPYQCCWSICSKSRNSKLQLSFAASSLGKAISRSIYAATSSVISYFGDWELFPFTCDQTASIWQWRFRLFPCLGDCNLWTMSTEVCVSFWNVPFSKYIPRSGISGLSEPPHCSP